MNVAIKLHRIRTCKTKICELLFCLMTSLHVKNNLKMYKNVEKRAK